MNRYRIVKELLQEADEKKAKRIAGAILEWCYDRGFSTADVFTALGLAADSIVEAVIESEKEKVGG